MDAITNKFSSKMLIIVAGVLAIIFVVLIILFFSNKSNPNQSSSGNSSISNKTSSSNPNLTTTPAASSGNSANFAGYKMSYPAVWSEKTIPVVGGGTLTHFAPKTTIGEAFPRVDVQATPISASSTSFSQIINNLSVLKLQQDTIIFHNAPATRLSGVLPYPFKIGNPPVLKNVYKTFILFDFGNKRYVIDYAYYLDGTEQQSIDLINQSLNSMILQ